MQSYLVWAVPLALLWTAISGPVNFEGFLVGYVLSLIILIIFRPTAAPLHVRYLPTQIIAALVYIVAMFRDIFLSSVDVSRRLLSRDMRLRPGVVALPTQDEAHRAVIAALSAHTITLTPGELVVEIEDDHLLYVHSLDFPTTATEGASVQARRLGLLRNIIGGGA